MVRERTVVVVPVSATLCGEPVALSVMLIEAEAEPAVVAVKAIVIVQLAETARVAGQLFA